MPWVVIHQGDWLGAIAGRFGFDDAFVIWNAPENSEIRRSRGSPDLLLVGDMLFVPEQPSAAVRVIVGRETRATFVRRQRPDVLRLRVPDVAALVRAFGPMGYVLEAGPHRLTGEFVGGDEVLEVPLDRSVRTATLWLMGRRVAEFSIGGLGPVDTPEGALGRLTNLGFVPALSSGQGTSSEEDESQVVAVLDPLATGISAFQRSHGLPVTGSLDPRTCTELRNAYGC